MANFTRRYSRKNRTIGVAERVHTFRVVVVFSGPRDLNIDGGGAETVRHAVDGGVGGGHDVDCGRHPHPVQVQPELLVHEVLTMRLGHIGGTIRIILEETERWDHCGGDHGDSD